MLEGFILDSDKASKVAVIAFILMSIFLSSLYAQGKPVSFNVTFIDSLLARYHLEGVTIFVKKLGVISLNQKTIAFKRKFMEDRLLISLQKNLSFDNSGFGAQFNYRLNTRWMIRGESYQRNWGRQNGIGIIYRLEY